MSESTDIKRAVRERYAGHAKRGDSCCGDARATRPAAASSCCGDAAATRSSGCCSPSEPSRGVSEAIGYDGADLADIPDGADLGLGCGNPLGMLELQPGETVLDLGSGGGIDCFLAAKRVGPTGRVIGVDMTPEMLDRARRNARDGGYDNVEFRLGEVEHLPVADGTVDAIISNCVINLVPDKRQAFAEAFRVLKPGGRLSLSDIVTLGEIPRVVRESAEAYVACLSGAILRDDYLALLRDVGFANVRVTAEQGMGDLQDAVAADLAEELRLHADIGAEEIQRMASLFQSVRVQAVKPG